MKVFDYANTSFLNLNDGQWKLNRDLSEHPPTQIEIEGLFALCMQVDQLLAPVANNFFAGIVQTAEELDNAKFEEVMHWLAAIRTIIGPPHPLPAEAMQTASVGPAE